MVRAKFRVSRITVYSEASKQIELAAVTADGIPENERYHKYTPSGRIEITIDNPPAAAQFGIGKELYVDFYPVEG